MRIFDEYGSNQITFLGDNAKSKAFANLSYTQAIAMLGVPSEERENFIQEHDLDNMSTRELQKAIKEREEAIKEKKEAEKAAQDASNNLEKEKLARLKAEREAETLSKKLQDYRVQRENYLQQIDEYKAKLKEAENSGNAEEIEILTKKLSGLNGEVEKLRAANEELETKLNQPIEVITAEPQVIEKIPDEVVQELQELRQKVNQPSGSDKSVVKFSLQFDGLVKGFKDLLGTLEEIQNTETKEKYKTAVKGLINKMAERL
jgi:chromosome segregation ATPase